MRLFPEKILSFFSFLLLSNLAFSQNKVAKEDGEYFIIQDKKRETNEAKLIF